MLPKEAYKLIVRNQVDVSLTQSTISLLLLSLFPGIYDLVVVGPLRRGLGNTHGSLLNGESCRPRLASAQTLTEANKVALFASGGLPLVRRSSQALSLGSRALGTMPKQQKKFQPIFKSSSFGGEADARSVALPQAHHTHNLYSR